MPSPKPLLKLVKQGTKAFKNIEAKPFSSAMKRLAGTIYKRSEWEEAKTIASVKSGKGDARWFTFTDGTALQVSKGEVHRQAQLIGSGRSVRTAMEEPTESQFRRAMNSFHRHASMYQKGTLNEFWSKSLIRREHGIYLKQIKDTGVEEETVPYVLVEAGEHFIPMPEHYARILEKHGVVKIPKGRGRGK